MISGAPSTRLRCFCDHGLGRVRVARLQRGHNRLGPRLARGAPDQHEAPRAAACRGRARAARPRGLCRARCPPGPGRRGRRRRHGSGGRRSGSCTQVREPGRFQQTHRQALLNVVSFLTGAVRLPGLCACGVHRRLAHAPAPCCRRAGDPGRRPLLRHPTRRRRPRAHGGAPRALPPEASQSVSGRRRNGGAPAPWPTR